MIERDGGTLCGVEVKAGASARPSDFKALERLRTAAGLRFHRGIVVYDGERTLPFGKGLFAVPYHELWRVDEGMGA